MNQAQFEQRIKDQLWVLEPDDKWNEPSEWFHSYGEEVFIRVGNKLVKKGFSYDEVLEILGECFGAVRNEYGD